MHRKTKTDYISCLLLIVTSALRFCPTLSLQVNRDVISAVVLLDSQFIRGCNAMHCKGIAFHQSPVFHAAHLSSSLAQERNRGKFHESVQFMYCNLASP